MKINELIDQLLRIRKEHGNIEVTCTGSTERDVGLASDRQRAIMDGAADVFETTVENLVVNTNHPVHGTAVRLWL